MGIRPAPAVLASLLGVHIQTAVNWASHTRRDWITYIHTYVTGSCMSAASRTAPRM